MDKKMKLEELVDHSHSEIHDLISEPEPFSVFEDYGNFKILILRHIHFDPPKLNFQSEVFLMKKSGFFHFDSNSNEFIKVENGPEGVVAKLAQYYSHNKKVMTGFSDQIERLEDYLFGRNVPRVFMDIWFSLKKYLSKIENYYYRNGIVYREFLRKAESHFGEYSDEFTDIEDEIRFQTSNVYALNARLDSIYRHFESIKGDRLNRTLVMLTFISGVFLPLNLIVGFFGMNTPGLYFMEDPNGTSEVLFLLISVLGISILGIPLIGFLDKYFLRFILGRYKFYQKFSSRFEEFGDRLKGN